MIKQFQKLGLKKNFLYICDSIHCDSAHFFEFISAIFKLNVMPGWDGHGYSHYR